MIELSRQADYTVLIAPETTGILANLTRSLEQAGARTLGCSAASIELAGNKARLAEWLEARGIPTPRSRTVVPAEGLPEGAGGPCVLKPIDGAGAIDTFFLTGPDDLPDAARQMPVALLQPFLPGTPMSASFLIDDANVAWLIAMGQQKITIRGGRFHYEGGTLPVPCREAEPVLRRAVASVTGLRGFVGVDFLWDANEEKATVLEINPRPTTSYVALIRLLPPGCLAQSWLASCGEPSCSRGACRHSPRSCTSNRPSASTSMVRSGETLDASGCPSVSRFTSERQDCRSRHVNLPNTTQWCRRRGRRPPDS